MKHLKVLLASLLIFGIWSTSRATDASVIDKARDIESRLSARVGLAIIDTGSERRWTYNAHDRFPMASTFKVFACGALLHQVDAGKDNLDRTMSIAQADLVTHSPVLDRLVGQQISARDLCAATLRTSDNAAANKILERIGGPAGWTQFMRRIGDDTTRLDRVEPALNEARPGDVRDTTSPAAIASALRVLVLGDALSPSSRELLTSWMMANEVGGPLLRASIPATWVIADRTGAGGHGARGIIAVMWPPARAPIVAAIYIAETEASMEDRNAAIADLGAALAAEVSQLAPAP